MFLLWIKKSISTGVRGLYNLAWNNWRENAFGDLKQNSLSRLMQKNCCSSHWPIIPACLEPAISVIKHRIGSLEMVEKELLLTGSFLDQKLKRFQNTFRHFSSRIKKNLTLWWFCTWLPCWVFCNKSLSIKDSSVAPGKIASSSKSQNRPLRSALLKSFCEYLTPGYWKEKWS